MNSNRVIIKNYNLHQTNNLMHPQDSKIFKFQDVMIQSQITKSTIDCITSKMAAGQMVANNHLIWHMHRLM